MSIRPVKSIVESQPTMEGAGVKLRRAFGFGNTSEFDPFLLFDDFRNDNPADYSAGFPWHPHRGIETITYVLAGTVDHGDSLGNRGTLGAGDVQWMTAGRGILHQEMPQGDAKGRMHGFQLWANLPSSQKMTAPRYQDVKAGGDSGDRRRRRHQGARHHRRVLGQEGPGRRRRGRSALHRRVRAAGPAQDAQGRDRAARVRLRVRRLRARSAGSSKPFGVLVEKEVDGQEIVVREKAGDRSLVLFDSGDEVTVQAGEQGIRFLLVSGKPIEEPVAWHGPIVMNTQAELQQAVAELRNGTFIRN